MLRDVSLSGQLSEAEQAKRDTSWTIQLKSEEWRASQLLDGQNLWLCGLSEKMPWPGGHNQQESGL